MRLYYLSIGLCYLFIVCGAEPQYKNSQPSRVKNNKEFKSRDKSKDTYDRSYRQKNTYKPKDAYNRPQKDAYNKPQKAYRPKPTSYKTYKPKYKTYKPGGYGGGYDSDVVTLDDGTRVVIKAYGPDAKANAEGTSQGQRIVGTTIGSDGRSRTIVYGDEQGSLYVNSDSIVAESDGGVNTRYNKLDGSGFVRMRGDGDGGTGKFNIYHSDGETQIRSRNYEGQTYRIGRGDVSLATLYTTEGPMNVDYRQKKGNLKTSGINNESTSGTSKYLFNVGGKFDAGKIKTGVDTNTDIRIKAQDIVRSGKLIDSSGNVKARVNAKNMYVDDHLANVRSGASQADLHFNVKNELSSGGVRLQAEGPSKVFIRAKDIIGDDELVSMVGPTGGKLDATVFANSIDIDDYEIFDIGGQSEQLKAKLRVKGDVKASDIIDSDGSGFTNRHIYAKTYIGGHADLDDVLDVDTSDTTVKMTSVFGKNVKLESVLDIDDDNTNVDFRGRVRGDLTATNDVFQLDDKGATLRGDLFVKGRIFSDGDDLFEIEGSRGSGDQSKAYIKVQAENIDVDKIVDFGDSKGAHISADVKARSGIVADKVFELSSDNTRDNKLYATIGSKYIDIRDQLGFTYDADNNEMNINFLKGVPNDDRIIEYGDATGNKYNLRGQKKNLRANVEQGKFPRPVP